MSVLTIVIGSYLVLTIVYLDFILDFVIFDLAEEPEKRKKLFRPFSRASVASYE